MKTPGFNETSDVAARAILQAYRPRHVRVAEALGWTDFRQGWDGKRIRAIGRPPGPSPSPLESAPSNATFPWQAFYVPDYDTDWSVTGPLIDRYNIALFWDVSGQHAAVLVAAVDFKSDEKIAYSPAVQHGLGETKLIAVCNLILALHAVGKLPK